MKRSVETKKAVTFIELIVVITVLAMGISALLGLLAEVSRRIASSESIAEATFYTEEKLEVVKSYSFEEVDNLVGDEKLSKGYIRRVRVDYCKLSGDTWVTTLTPTEYKMITVSVFREGSSTPEAEIATIISDYEN